MPVLVNPPRCLDRVHCFAASGCPYGAYRHNVAAKTWEVDATICGDCPGPCLNFCDADAVLWADNLFELDLLKQQLAGTLTAEEAAERRAAEREAVLRAAEEAARKTAVAIVHITRANFQTEVLAAKQPVLMDCWAAWCAPCKQFAPTFEAFAGRYAGIVKCVKLDTEAEPAVARSLGIAALPTLVLFYQGQLVDGAQGALSAQQLESWIAPRLDLLRRQFGLPAASAAPAAGPAAQPAETAASALVRDANAAPPAPAAPADGKRRDKPAPRLYLP